MKIIDELRRDISKASADYLLSRRLSDLPERVGNAITAIQSKMNEAKTAYDLVYSIRADLECLATDWISILFGATEESMLKRVYLKVLSNPKYGDMKLLVATTKELLEQNSRLEKAISAGGGDPTMQNRMSQLEIRCAAYERQLSELRSIRDGLIDGSAHLEDLLGKMGDEPGFEAFIRGSKLTPEEQEEILRFRVSGAKAPSIPAFA